MGNEHNDREYYEGLLKKYLDHQCTESELKLVAELLTNSQHQEILPELLHRASQKFHSGFKMNKEHGDMLWDKVSSEIYTQDQSRKKGKLLFSVARIAASVALIFGAAYFVQLHFYKEAPLTYTTKTTDHGQRLTFVLDDGSKVKLNAGSTITFPEKFEGGAREIELSGEAFFEVKRDPERPFIVSTGNINTKVLGTSFNVSAFPDQDIVVTVSSGKVQVSATADYPSSGKSSDNQPVDGVILTTGQQATYYISNKHLTRREVILDQIIGWKDGILRFNETPLGEVAEILQRWYNVNIRFDNNLLTTCTVTSTFKGESIEDVLDELKFIFKLNYTIDGREVAISGKGCEQNVN